MGIQSVQYSPALLIGAGTGDGSSAANAGSSALSIKQRTGTSTDGIYWVKPPNGIAQLVWCDMNTDGGGWMLVARTRPGAAPTAGTWGWRATTVVGGPEAFFGPGSSNGYCMDSLNWYNNGFRFTDYIFGNQLTNDSNAWGPFIYKVSLIDPVAFMTSDTQQSAAVYSTLKSNTNVYGSTAFPSMQYIFGFAATSTAANIFFMRDCCGPDSGYGMTPTGIVTTYCSSASPALYSGPWCNGATLSGNTWVQGGSSLASNTGGTNQAMIMVR